MSVGCSAKPARPPRRWLTVSARLTGPAVEPATRTSPARAEPSGWFWAAVLTERARSTAKARE
jgi:hypothetical protein